MNHSDDLLKHSGWLRALARSLVADSQAADDLVQDTWTAALRHPYQHEARPWLGRVLRNFAKQRFRENSRRLRRERATAHEEALPSADELAQRMELQRAMVDHVMSLEEPYGSTLVLRYYEGLSAAEIARKKGIPGATVRSHLKRGLDELRRRLDESQEGGREAWSAVLLPWITKKPTIAASLALAAPPILHGILTMSTGAKLFLSAAVAVLAYVGYQRVNPEVMRPDQSEEPIEALVALTAPAPEAESHSPQETSAKRSVIAAPVEQPIASEAPVVRQLLSAQIVDEQLAPVSGARLAIASLSIDSAPTGTEGQVRLELVLEEPGSYSVKVSCEGYATNTLLADLKPNVAADLGVIVLQPVGRITGLVVDEQDRPVPGAEIIVSPRVNQLTEIKVLRRAGPDRYRGILQERTDADGRFVVDDVVAERVLVWAGDRGKLWAVSEPVSIDVDGAPVDLLLKLESPAPDEVLEGTVLSPEGNPVAGCTVRGDYRGQLGYFVRWATTDVHGGFTFLGVQGLRTDFRAKDPDEVWSDAVLRGGEAGGPVVLRFEQTRTIEVRVQNAAEESLPGANVRAIARFERDTQLVGQGRPDTGEGGHYQLQEPAEPFHLSVKLDGYADYESETFAKGALPDGFLLTLTKLPGIEGVVTIDGRPAANASMKIARVMSSVGDKYQVIHHQGFLTELDPYAGFDFKTDERGHFSFAPQKAGDYAIRAEREGFAPGELRVQNYQPNTGIRGLELSLNQGGSIRGELIPRSGDDVAGMRVAASRGDAHVLIQRVGQNGLFRFGQLIPGRWNLEVIEDEIKNLPTSHSIRSEPMELPWVCTVFENETTHHDLDLSGQSDCIVSGELTVDGDPAAGWTAMLESTGGTSHRASEVPQVVVDKSGQFQLSLAKAGTYRLSLFAPTSQSAFRIFDDIELEAGELEWSLAVQTQRVVIDNVPAAGQSDFSYRLFWNGPDGASCNQPLAPDATGRCVFERFPAGLIRVMRFSASVAISQKGIELLTGVVEQGGDAHFTLP